MKTYPVLLVGGPARVRERVRITLESAGYAVVAADGWEEGVRVARRARPRLLLLVPNEGEGESQAAVALRQLRSHPTTHRIPAVALGEELLLEAELVIAETERGRGEGSLLQGVLGNVQYTTERPGARGSADWRRNPPVRAGRPTLRELLVDGALQGFSTTGEAVKRGG